MSYGNTWDEVNLGINAPAIRALAINGAGHIFAGVYGINLNTGGVFRSLNNGDNWEAVNAGLTQLHVLALGFDRHGRILAGTDGSGVFRSINITTSVDEEEGEAPRIKFFRPARTRSFSRPRAWQTACIFIVSRPENLSKQKN